MKKKSFRAHLSATVVGLFFSIQVLAQGEDITSLINYLQRVLNAAVESIAESIYQINTLLPKTVATNLVEPKAQTLTDTYTRALTFCQIYSALPRHNKLTSDPQIPDEFKSIATNNLGENQENSGKLSDFCQKLIQFVVNKDEPLAYKKSLSSLPATDMEKPKGFGTFVNQLKGGGSASLLGNHNLNFDSLIAPTLYQDANEQQNALRFIAFSGKTYEPLPVDPDTWRLALEKHATHPDFMNYQMTLRSFIAAQSVALSNLYRMIAERTTQPDIEKLNLKNEVGDDIKSPMQYQEYLATHRVNDPDWYNMINRSSTAAVSREMVYMLAEIQRSLHRMEQTNERILATLSLIELINLNIQTRPELKAMAPAVKELLTEGRKEGE